MMGPEAAARMDDGSRGPLSQRIGSIEPQPERPPKQRPPKGVDALLREDAIRRPLACGHQRINLPQVTVTEALEIGCNHEVCPGQAAQRVGTQKDTQRLG